jgi:hypothetical protein
MPGLCFQVCGRRVKASLMQQSAEWTVKHACEVTCQAMAPFSDVL